LTNYYFISSPLHLCIAVNIAIENYGEQHVAVFISKNPVASDAYATAVNHRRDIFDEVVILAADQGYREILLRKKKYVLLEKIFSKPEAMRIFTGNDRRSEFQYAMYIARKYHPQVEGVYMDDGAISYAGHKSINRIQHRYIDPLLKKLILGKWWKKSLTVGATDWVDSAYVAFPDAVHPLLKKKKLIKLDADIFKSERFMIFAADFLGADVRLRRFLSQSQVIVTLPHEAAFLAEKAVYKQLNEMLCRFYRCTQITIKGHPRAKDIDAVQAVFPDVTVLGKDIGMEFLLPFLSDRCLVIGDISTTLLTAKWLRPDLTVIAITVDKTFNEQLTHLYEKLAIKTITIDHLPALIQQHLSNK